jgi:polyphosphate glucokinase
MQNAESPVIIDPCPMTNNKRPMTNKILGIDIGGSALKGAPVDTKTGRVLAERYRIETPKAVTPAKMAKLVAEIAGHFRWRGPIGIGFPGVIQGPRILTSANMHKGFIGLDGGKLFSKAAGCDVALINDAAAAGLAEMTFGAGRNFGGKVLLLTLGTGVGSVLFHRGAIFPCELGHLPFKGRDAEKLVAASIRKKEGLSWGQWSRELGRYLSLLENILWPELIILGGGVSAKHEKFFKYLKLRTRVVPAEFFNQAGIVGAALWAGQGKRST